MKRFHCMTSVWGRRYTDYFLEISLPSQLWSNNLVYFAANTESIYRIYTTDEDAETIKASPTFATLSNLMPVEIKLMDFEGKAYMDEDFKYKIMNEMHRESIEIINERESTMVTIQPDFIFSEGFFRGLLNIASTGKRAIILIALRLSQETLWPELVQNYSKDGFLQPIDNRDLVKLALRHLHPDTKSLIWGSDERSLEPSWLIWKVADEGLLVRPFHAHPMMLDPVDRTILPEVTVDADYLVKACPNFDDIHVVQDSDEMVVFETSSELHRRWPIRSGTQTIEPVRHWAKLHTNEHHREYARHAFRLHAEDLSKKWLEVEEEAGSVVDSVLSFALRAGETRNVTLSVLVINSGDSECLYGSLDSILWQCYGVAEIIVLDDNPSANGAAIRKRFGETRPAIEIVRRASHEGGAADLNQLLEQASSDYVCFMFSGDSVDPGFFEQAIELLSAFPECGMCCADFSVRDAISTEPSDHWMNWGNEEPYRFTPDELVEVILGAPISTNACIVKRSALVAAGGFISELKWHSAWFTLLVVAFREDVWQIPGQLATIAPREDGYVGSERANKTTQREISEHLLGLLRSESYRDILPYFVRGNSLANLGDEILSVVMSKPEQWDMVTQMLIQGIWWQRCLHVSIAEAEKARRSQQLSNAVNESRLTAFLESGNLAIEENRLDDAFAIFDNLIRAFPENMTGYQVKALLESKIGKYDLARSTLSAALKITPGDPTLYIQLGDTHSNAGDIRAAEQAYRKALDLNPTSREARLKLSRLSEHEYTSIA